VKTSYQILYWRDIPVQIKIRSGKDRLNSPLSSRFQEAADEAAMRAKATSTDEYLEEWRASAWQDSNQDAESLLSTLLEEIETDYSEKILKRLITNHGFNQRD
jgi:hypothetical protein